jgi:hypothetical protein
LSAIEAAKDEDLTDILNAVEARRNDIDKVGLIAKVKEIAEASRGERRFIIGYFDDEHWLETRKGTVFADGRAAIDDRNYSHNGCKDIDAVKDYFSRNYLGSSVVHVEYIDQHCNKENDDDNNT